MREVDKKIARGHQRLKLSKEQSMDVGQSSMLFGGPNDEKIKMLTERINDLVDQAETLGCEGEGKAILLKDIFDLITPHECLSPFQFTG